MQVQLKNCRQHDVRLLVMSRSRSEHVIVLLILIKGIFLASAVKHSSHWCHCPHKNVFGDCIALPGQFDTCRSRL